MSTKKVYPRFFSHNRYAFLANHRPYHGIQRKSAVWATYKFNDSFFFAKRQLLFAGLGVCAMFVIMNIDYWMWRTWAKPIVIICFVMLVLVLIPGVGLVRNGSQKLDRSWSVFDSAFRIYEVCYDYIFSEIFDRKTRRKLHLLEKGMLPALLLVFLPFGIIMMQPDLGTGTVLVGTCLVMIFVSGAKVSHFCRSWVAWRCRFL